jgi:hypothetical protein
VLSSSEIRDWYLPSCAVERDPIASAGGFARFDLGAEVSWRAIGDMRDQVQNF